jgi:hypothetical protein
LPQNVVIIHVYLEPKKTWAFWKPIKTCIPVCLDEISKELRCPTCSLELQSPYNLVRPTYSLDKLTSCYYLAPTTIIVDEVKKRT